CGRTAEGAGCVTWWGFGPARDLLSSVGSGDPRHILKTITGLALSDTLHIWVIENSMEVVARQLLLLHLSLLTSESMSLHKKTEVFLEVFGNSQIRKETEEVLKQSAAQLSLSITNSLSSDSHGHQCLNTSLLRFKERDELVRIFREWQRPPPVSILKVWDARVRKHLGIRYDSRRGAFDWDLTMKLHERGCGVINKHQYVKWRESGVAFEMREGLYQSANHSLLSSRVFSYKGDRVAARGYWGDIVSSPYLSFGIETEDEELLKKHNNQHTKTAQDISEANLLLTFEALASRGHSTLNEHLQNHTTSCSRETDKLPTEEREPNADQQTQELDLLPMKGVRISFLSPDSLRKLPLKNKYSQFFNSIFCSASFLLDLSNDQVSGFADRVKEIAEESGFASADDYKSPVYAVFTRKQELCQ
ncbi:hypothetical protein DNTS_032752, partial [Danionella cerebrum]